MQYMKHLEPNLPHYEHLHAVGATAPARFFRDVVQMMLSDQPPPIFATGENALDNQQPQ